MSDGMALFLTNLSGAAGCVWLGTMLWRTTAGNLPRREAWTRHKLCGTVMAYIAFIVCVPYAKVVSPDFLIPLLWPLAFIMPVVCGWFVDYPTARGVGGLAILLSYLVVHAGFEMKIPGAPLFAVAAWLFGIAGIWLSALPWKLRDLFRANEKMRRAWALFLFVFAVLLVLETVLWALR